jgi:hypothetical protein
MLGMPRMLEMLACWGCSMFEMSRMLTMLGMREMLGILGTPVMLGMLGCY